MGLSGLSTQRSVHEDVGPILALLCGLKIQPCYKLCHSSQMRLRSGVAVALVSASSCSSDSTPGPGISISHRYSPKKHQKTNTHPPPLGRNCSIFFPPFPPVVLFDKEPPFQGLRCFSHCRAVRCPNPRLSSTLGSGFIPGTSMSHLQQAPSLRAGVVKAPAGNQETSGPSFSLATETGKEYPPESGVGDAAHFSPLLYVLLGPLTQGPGVPKGGLLDRTSGFSRVLHNQPPEAQSSPL